MRKILVAAVIIMFAAGVNAQAGMPQELTCTERAFNLTFSVGTNWKLSVPKMGPVEVTRSGLNYSPAWCLKPSYTTSGTQMLSLFEKPLKGEALLYPVNQKSYTSLFYNNSFSPTGKPNDSSIFPPTSINLFKPKKSAAFQLQTF